MAPDKLLFRSVSPVMPSAARNCIGLLFAAAGGIGTGTGTGTGAAAAGHTGAGRTSSATDGSRTRSGRACGTREAGCCSPPAPDPLRAAICRQHARSGLAVLRQDRLRTHYFAITETTAPLDNQTTSRRCGLRGLINHAAGWWWCFRAVGLEGDPEGEDTAFRYWPCPRPAGREQSPSSLQPLFSNC